MRYKLLVTALYLCITLAFTTLPANAGQAASLNPHQTTSLSDTVDAMPGTGKTEGRQTGPDLLDTAWIFGFTMAGLLLLRKVQGE